MNLLHFNGILVKINTFILQNKKDETEIRNP